MIDDYLAELLAHLRLPERRRRRIAAEVEDHLACTAADLHADGLPAQEAEREAIRRFGSAGELARTFLEQEAARAGRSAGWAGAALAFVSGVLMLGAPGSAVFRGDFPLGVVPFVLGQVALVAGGLTLARAWLGGAHGRLRGPRLALVLRGTLVVLSCAGIGLLFGAGRGLTEARWGPGHWVPLGALAVASAATAIVQARAARRARATPAARPPDAEHPDSARHDLIAPVLQALGLARHPWRAALAISAAAGVALAAAHGLTEGGLSTHHLLRQLAGGAIIAGVEAAAALLGFAVLGRYLGLRSGTGAPSPGPRSSAAR
jgi:hypothetical protein